MSSTAASPPAGRSGTRPVVITGATGGAIGGSGGAVFGSGLTSLTHTLTSIFSPNVEQWVRRAAEDQQMNAERRAEYRSLQQRALQAKAAREKFRRQSRANADAAFVNRQQQLAAEAAADQKASKAYRKEALLQNRKDTMMDEPGYGPDRWTWPKAHHHPRHCNGTGGAGVGENDVLLTAPLLQPGAMVLSPTKDIANDSLLVLSDRELSEQQGERALLELAERLPATLEEMKTRHFAIRQHRRKEEAASEEEKKQERETVQKTMRAQEHVKAAEAKSAELRRARQIKKEMAEETARERQRQAERERKRFERGQAERKESQHRLHLAETDRLRSEAEIANERREGSKMSEGGKADFVAAMKRTDKTHDDVEEFM